MAGTDNRHKTKRRRKKEKEKENKKNTMVIKGKNDILKKMLKGVDHSAF